LSCQPNTQHCRLGPNPPRQRSRAPATISRRVGLALIRRPIVFRQATARQATQTLELAKPRIRRSAERRALGLPLCDQYVPKYKASADTLRYVLAIKRPMSPEEFQQYYPRLLAWIDTTLRAHAANARTVVSRGFPRLPFYFTADTLASAQRHVPNTFFLKRHDLGNEAIYFHELSSVADLDLSNSFVRMWKVWSALEVLGHSRMDIASITRFTSSATSADYPRYIGKTAPSRKVYA
jgi:hypothetical protein